MHMAIFRIPITRIPLPLHVLLLPHILYTEALYHGFSVNLTFKAVNFDAFFACISKALYHSYL